MCIFFSDCCPDCICGHILALRRFSTTSLSINYEYASVFALHAKLAPCGLGRKVNHNLVISTTFIATKSLRTRNSCTPVQIYKQLLGDLRQPQTKNWVFNTYVQLAKFTCDNDVTLFHRAKKCIFKNSVDGRTDKGEKKKVAKRLVLIRRGWYDSDDILNHRGLFFRQLRCVTFPFLKCTGGRKACVIQCRCQLWPRFGFVCYRLGGVVLNCPLPVGPERRPFVFHVYMLQLSSPNLLSVPLYISSASIGSHFENMLSPELVA